MRQLLGVDFLVSGAYGPADDGGGKILRFDFRLWDAVSGELTASLVVDGTVEDLPAVVGEAGLGLRQALGLASPSAATLAEVAAALPTDPTAAQLYAEGLDKLRRFDALGARDRLRSADEAQGDQPMILAALAESWSMLGYGARAEAAARQAIAASQGLPLEQRLLIEGRGAEVRLEWERAIEVYRTLWRSHSDHIEYGLRLADAQIEGDFAEEALATLAELRALEADDPRLDLLAALAHYKLGDFRQARALADRAAARGKVIGAGLLVARARIRETAALQELGEHRDALAALKEARRLFEAVGDLRGTAEAYELMAHSVSEQGDRQSARGLFQRAREVHTELGDKLGEARVIKSLGDVELRLGRLQEAERLHDEALKVFREIGAELEAAKALSNTGVRFHIQGQLAAALASYEAARQISTEIGDRAGLAFDHTNVAEVLYLRGELEAARQGHEAALAINREIGDRLGQAYDTFRLGKVFTARGDLEEAGSRLRQALVIQEEVGDPTAAAETRMALAEVLLLAGDAAGAEREASAAVTFLRDEDPVLAGRADAVLARAFLAKGRADEAAAASERATAAAADSDDRRLQLEAALVGGLVQAAAGAVEPALDALDILAASAAEEGFVGYAFDARLAAGEIAQAAGRRETGERLAALAEEARARGFAGIAQRASGLRS